MKIVNEVAGMVMTGIKEIRNFSATIIITIGTTIGEVNSKRKDIK
jgi:phage-related protein